MELFELTAIDFELQKKHICSYIIYNLQTAVASSFSSNNSAPVMSNLLRAKSSMFNP